MGCCGSFSKFIVVIVNLIFLIVGLVPLVFGIIALASREVLKKVLSYIPGLKDLEDLDLTEIIQSCSIVLVVLGSVIVLIGILGCFGACCDVKWMLYTYLLLLVLVVIGEIVVIILAVAYPSTFTTGGQNLLKTSLKEYKQDCHLNKTGSSIDCSNDAVTIAWNAMQYELECCGAKEFRDYQNFTWTKRNDSAVAPLTCCKHKSGKIGGISSDSILSQQCVTTGDKEIDYYEIGCFEAIIEWVVTSAVVIGVLSGIGALEIILIIMTLVLACKRDKD